MRMVSTLLTIDLKACETWKFENQFNVSAILAHWDHLCFQVRVFPPWWNHYKEFVLHLYSKLFKWIHCNKSMTVSSSCCYCFPLLLKLLMSKLLLSSLPATTVSLALLLVVSILLGGSYFGFHFYFCCCFIFFIFGVMAVSWLCLVQFVCSLSWLLVFYMFCNS